MKLSLLREEIRRYHADKFPELVRPATRTVVRPHLGNNAYRGSFSGYEVWGDFDEEDWNEPENYISLQCTKGDHLAHWRCLAHWCKCPCHKKEESGENYSG